METIKETVFAEHKDLITLESAKYQNVEEEHRIREDALKYIARVSKH